MNAVLPALNFPSLEVRVKIIQNRPQVFDPIRKKYYLLSPEEWVRQHCIAYLMQAKGYPGHRILVEKAFPVFGTVKRFDLMVVSRAGEGWLLVECKSPSVEIEQNAFDQIGRYNIELGAPYLWITNGGDHYKFHVDYESGACARLMDLPSFSPEF